MWHGLVIVSCVLVEAGCVGPCAGINECSLCEAAKRFLLDLQAKTPDTEGWAGGVRWGPLLAYSWMHNCRYTQNPEGYIEPAIGTDTYKQLADDALAGIQLWLPRLGLERVHRRGATTREQISMSRRHAKG